MRWSFHIFSVLAQSYYISCSLYDENIFRRRIMSSLSFGQKKKKQALRRLSHGASPRTSASGRQERPQRPWAQRRRSREDAEESGRSSGIRDTKRTRGSQQSSGDSDSNSSGQNPFSGRRRIVRSEDSQGLVISKRSRDTSDSDTALTGDIPPAGHFGRIKSSQFGSQDEAGAGSSDSGPSVAMNPFASKSGNEAISDNVSVKMNPFAKRTIDSGDTAAASTFRFAVPGVSSADAKTSSVSASGFGQSGFSQPQGTMGQHSVSETGQSKAASDFTFTIKQTSAGSARVSSSVTQSAAGVPQGSRGGSKPSSISTFTFRRPSDVDSPPQIPSGGGDSAGVFGMKSEPSSAAARAFTFAKPKSDTFGTVKMGSPTKRPSTSSHYHHHSDSYTKRQITDWSDPFSEGQDLSDLETFGAGSASPTKQDDKPRKALIKRSNLLDQAISDTASRGDRRSESRRHDRKREEDRYRDGDKRRREVDRRRNEDRPRRDEDRDRRDKDKRRREQDENQLEKSSPSKTTSRSTAEGSSRRFDTSAEIKQKCSIVIKNVPEETNSKSFLKNYFTAYGTVIKVSSMPSRSQAVIYFDNHDSAATAKKKVRVLKPNTKPVQIFYHQSSSSGPRPSSRGPTDKPEIKLPERAFAPINRTTNPPASTDKPVATRHKDTAPSSSPHRGKPAITAEERRDLLELRDKAIRLGYKAQQRGRLNTQHLKGTCPDMCPEKERYVREYQRRLSRYETLEAPDKVHHPTAVKEYSRSSADQEEPLHHELRPAPVLMMTMNYLLNNIMDRGEKGSWADWFDFLWNCTRAIRKDITQQHLRDVSAVELMEKCARFHIFCAHRLCEQDRGVFDPKINNENLTKCQQSLKQFYHDLANEDIFCPSEAEFRAYDVLLNLNEGDILRQVQQYRPEVRGSDEVKFAVKVFSALSSNNYVRYFKLVRSANYLQACIMHRYFAQMRNLAVVIMNKAYSGPRATQYPVAELVRLLAFEGENEATQFCLSHGFTVSDGTVLLNRSSYLQPESAIASFRSVSIIEVKNSKSIGEVVNGAPLPPNYIHEPSSSFDESGYYKGDITSSLHPSEQHRGDITSSAQSSSIQQVEESAAPAEITIAPSIEPVAPSTTQPTEIATVPKRPHHQYSNAAVKDVAKEMFLEVINEMARDLSQNFLQWVHFVQMGSFELVNKVLGESLAELNREVAMETLQEEQRRHLEMKRAEQRRAEQQRQQLELAAEREKQALETRRLRQESLDKASTEAIEDIVEEVVVQESKNLALNEYRHYMEAQAELKRHSVARSTEVVSDKILKELLVEECHHIADEVIETAIVQRDQKLAELEKCVVMSRTARYLQKWRHVYTLRVHLKRSQLTFPAAPPNISLEDQCKALWPSRDESGRRQLNSTKSITLDTPFSVISGRETVATAILQRHYIKCIRKQKAWAPFDLPTMLHTSLNHSHHAPHSQFNHMYWKLVMSLPDDGPQMSRVEREGYDWLKAKLRRGKLQDRFCEETLHDNDKVQTLSLYTAEKEQPQRGQQNLPMRLCTKVTKGHVRDYGNNQLLGTSALMFVVDGSDETDWSERLLSVLQAKPTTPAIPVLVVILGDLSSIDNVQSQCEERLRLRGHQHAGWVSLYRTVIIGNDVEDPWASDELLEGIQWLAEHCPLVPHTSDETLKGFIDTGLMELFSLPLHEDAKLRRNAGLAEQDAQSVVALYNSVVRHLGAVASSQSLMDLSWPVAEFARTLRRSELPKPNWNLPKRLRLLNERILGLLLPEMPSVHQDCDWKTVCESINQYLCDVLPGTDRDKAPLISRVQWLLDRSRRSFQNTCYLTHDTPGCEPTAQHIPWTSIIEACISHMVSHINTEDDNYHDDDPVTVYYFKSEFDSFTSPPHWKQATIATREDTFMQTNSLNTTLLDTVNQQQRKLAEQQYIEEILSESMTVSKVILEDEAPSFVAAKDTAEQLKMMLHAEKQETQRYEALLSSWLNDSTDLNDSQTVEESTDSSTPLTVHIPYSKHEEKTTTSPAQDIAATVVREGARAGSQLDETLSERLINLKRQIAMERRADEMEEIRLAQMLDI